MQSSRSSFSHPSIADIRHVFSGVADVSVAMDKDLIGSPQPSVEGNELDSAAGDDTKNAESSKAETKTESAMAPMGSVSEGSGIGLLSKMVFFVAICGAIFAFLKTRKTPGMAERSLA